MTAIATFALAQVDPGLAAQVGRIATAQIVMAVTMVLIGLAVISAGIAAVMALRAVNRLIKRIERSVEQLTPQVQPLIERATRIATDANDISDKVRRRVNEVTDTIDDLNRNVRKAAAGTEQRVRDFAAVLDVVQAEAEEILLDTAATARGLHATAESLRGGDGARKNLPARKPAQARLPDDT